MTLSDIGKRLKETGKRPFRLAGGSGDYRFHPGEDEWVNARIEYDDLITAVFEEVEAGRIALRRVGVGEFVELDQPPWNDGGREADAALLAARAKVDAMVGKLPA